MSSPIPLRIIVPCALLLSTLVGCGTKDESSGIIGKTNVYINELMPSNQTIIADENDEYDDWIELYNPDEDHDASLAGYFISDDRNDPLKRWLPQDAVVPADGYLLLWADGSPDQGALHLSFKLRASEGEAVILTDPDGKEIDSTDFEIPNGEQSFGRFPDGEGDFEWCDLPTPGESNGDECGTL